MWSNLSVLCFGVGLGLVACSSSNDGTNRSQTAANAGAAGTTDTGSAGIDTGSAGTIGAGGAGMVGTGSAGMVGAAGASSLTLVVSPAVAHVSPGGTAQFTAKLGGSTEAPVTWSVKEGASGGSISASGLYTAPASPGSFHVVATSQADERVTGSALVTSGVIGDCTKLPAAGTWEMISPLGPTESGGKNYAEAVVVDPFDPATVWFGTGFAGMFKSTDCGASWTKVNTGRNAKEMDNGSHISLAIDPVDRGTMYTVSLFGAWGLWKTTNGGVDWDQLFASDSEFAKLTSNAIDAVVMDPLDHLHLILGMHSNCAAPYAPTCTAETTDGGASWTIVKLPTTNWEEGAGPSILDAKRWLYGGKDLWLTTDGAATWKKVTPEGTWNFSGGEVSSRPIIQTADGTYLLTSSQGFVSSKDGLTWSLVPKFNKRVVALTLNGGRLFATDQWSKGIYTALESDHGTWTTVTPMADLPDDQGAPFVDYDAAHKVLYTGHFAGGLWRTVAP